MAQPFNHRLRSITVLAAVDADCRNLQNNLRISRDQGNTSRALKKSLTGLLSVLDNLLYTAINQPGIDLAALVPSLECCIAACGNYDVCRRTELSCVQSQPSPKTLDDVNVNFSDMLDVYRSTAMLGLIRAKMFVQDEMPLSNANGFNDVVRSEANLTIEDVKIYAEMISDTNSALEDQSKNSSSACLLDIAKEKVGIEQSKVFCAQVLEELRLLDPVPSKDSRASSVSQTFCALHKLEQDLQLALSRYLESIATSQQGASDELAAQLKVTGDAIRQCIQALHNDDTPSAVGRKAFRKINDEYCDASGPVPGVIARRVNITGNSGFVAGQISGESFHHALEAMARHKKDDRGPDDVASRFDDRYGPGTVLGA